MRELATTVQIAPRRLGHANLFVGQLERSLEFYNRVCGLEEVRREPGIGAGFLSNGSTHHDIGLIQVGEQARVGLDGHVQVPKGRGTRPGLNHLGWEMETEQQLVDAHRRARAAKAPIHRTTNHQISHSVYMFDPEGNLNEFYADVMKDWRTLFNPFRDDLVSGPWDPDAQPASREANYNPKPEIRRVAGAMFHPVRISHAVLVARELGRLRDFYVDVGGLRLVAETPQYVCLRGTETSIYDLTLFQMTDSLRPGLHHVGFELADSTDVENREAALRAAGVPVETTPRYPAKRSVVFRDPDGLGIEMYAVVDPRGLSGSDSLSDREPYVF